MLTLVLINLVLDVTINADPYSLHANTLRLR